MTAINVVQLLWHTTVFKSSLMNNLYLISYIQDMWEKENGVEAGLPGHSYSPKQLFWIAAAQVILQVIY